MDDWKRILFWKDEDFTKGRPVLLDVFADDVKVDLMKPDGEETSEVQLKMMCHKRNFLRHVLREHCRLGLDFVEIIQLNRDMEDDEKQIRGTGGTVCIKL